MITELKGKYLLRGVWFYCSTRGYEKRLHCSINVSTLLSHSLHDAFIHMSSALKLVGFLMLCHSVNVRFPHLLILILLLSGDIEVNPGPMTRSDTSGILSILHLNVRSIRNKLEYVFDYFSDHDIMCFTETHLRQYCV